MAWAAGKQSGRLEFGLGWYIVSCPWLKALLVSAGNFAFYHRGRLPTWNASNGLRLFSQRSMGGVGARSRDMGRGHCGAVAEDTLRRTTHMAMDGGVVRRFLREVRTYLRHDSVCVELLVGELARPRR
jgi:hypothetical protein